MCVERNKLNESEQPEPRKGQTVNKKTIHKTIYLLVYYRLQVFGVCLYFTYMGLNVGWQKYLSNLHINLHIK